MQYGSALGQNGATQQVEPQSRIPAAMGTILRELPYDYVATFKLTGEPSKRTQDVINVSTEGVFVAVSIGYSFAPNPRALPFPQVAGTPASFTVNGASVSGVAPFNLLSGLDAAAFNTPPAPAPPRPTFAEQLARSILLGELARHSPIQFRYTIVDSGSGRELQNQAIHNIAGLGSADGERPFRPLAKPALFVPRSTIRIEIEEISEGPLFRDGTLFIVLHGYKRLGE
jgi:hypothetical protein